VVQSVTCEHYEIYRLMFTILIGMDTTVFI